MKRVCVFCGSSPGARPGYSTAARELGRILARRKIGLVYGGGDVGLMGVIARATVEAGGEVTGVIPRWLVEKEVAYTGLKDLRIVDSMHERKALMAELSDGFIAMPGGLGTIEEFFEALTWAQLGIHVKPCGLLNVEGYYDRLTEFVCHMADESFMRPENLSMLLTDENPERLLDALDAYVPKVADKAAWAIELTGRSTKVWENQR